MGSILSSILYFPVKDISFKQKFSKIGAWLAEKHSQVRALGTLVLSRLVHYQSTAALPGLHRIAFPSNLTERVIHSCIWEQWFKQEISKSTLAISAPSRSKIWGDESHSWLLRYFLCIYTGFQRRAPRCSASSWAFQNIQAALGVGDSPCQAMDNTPMFLWITGTEEFGLCNKKDYKRVGCRRSLKTQAVPQIWDFQWKNI